MVLPRAILFPRAMLPLYIFEPRYRRMLADSLETHRLFAVAMQKPGSHREIPCAVAGLGIIRASVNNQDGTSHLILQGITRVQLMETVRYKPYRVQRIKLLEPVISDSVAIDALTARISELAVERLEQRYSLTMPTLKKLLLSANATELDALSTHTLKQLADQLSAEADPNLLADAVAATLLEKAEQRQTILATINLEDRLKRLIHFLMAEIEAQRKNNN